MAKALGGNDEEEAALDAGEDLEAAVRLATTLPLQTRMTLAPVTLAPEASVTTPRMEAAEHRTAQARRRKADEKDKTRLNRGWCGGTRKQAEAGMKAPSFPSERKRVGGAEDRSPDLRLFQPPSHERTQRGWSAVVDEGLRSVRKNPGWFPALAERTGQCAGALTVAGQWRSFTAFPSILAIAVVGCAALEGAAGKAWNGFPCYQLL